MNVRSAADKGADIQARAETLYRKYGPMVTRRCRQLLGNEDDAADAAHEVFVKLIGGRQLLAAQYPSSLLWTMATNHCLNILRDTARRGGNEDGGSFIDRIACLSADNDIEARIGAASLLDKLFGRHPGSVRAIAVLRLVDGMTLDETAKETGLSVSWVKKKLKALKKDLKSLEVYDE